MLSPWLIMALTNLKEDRYGGRDSSGASSWLHLAIAFFISTVYIFMFSEPQQLSMAFIFIHFFIISLSSSATTTAASVRSAKNFIFCVGLRGSSERLQFLRGRWVYISGLAACRCGQEAPPRLSPM